MYNRETAPEKLKPSFHIRDKRGEDIQGALRYDPVTGQGYKKDIYGNEIEFWAFGGFVDIAGKGNPEQAELDAIYAANAS